MAGRSDYRKLTVIIDALSELKAQILPEQEMQVGDDIDRSKLKITGLVKGIKEDIAALKTFQNERDVITKKSELRRKFIEVNAEMKNFTEALTKAAKEKPKDKDFKKRDARVKQGQQWAELTQGELMNLAGEARDVQVTDTGAAFATAGGARAERREREKKMRMERRREQRRRKAEQSGGSVSAPGVDDDDIFIDDSTPASAQEQEFMKQMEQNRREEEEMLDAISQGLTELHELAVTLNKLLKQSQSQIDELDVKMDNLQTRFETTNQRLEKLLDETGGLSRWCPMCICLALLLALAAYIYSKFQ